MKMLVARTSCGEAQRTSLAVLKVADPYLRIGFRVPVCDAMVPSKYETACSGQI